MAEGYDGFEPLKDRKMIIDDETGQRMSNILRSFLLGGSKLYHMVSRAEDTRLAVHLSPQAAA